MPPPGRHPHQGQMNAVLMLFLVFAFLALVLSAILVSASLATLMTRQVREIGICKAIGAGSAQVSALYLLMLLVVCGIAVLFAAPLSRLAAGLLVGQIGGLLNLDIKDASIPWWVLLVVVAGGTLVPLAVAAYPVLRGGRISALEALNSYGVSAAAFGKGRMQAMLGRLRVPGSILTLSLRNVFRSRSRLAMTLLLLAVGGALFMTALDTSKAWNVNLEKIYKYRHYDLEVRLFTPFPASQLIPSLRGIPGVREVEAWGQSPAAFSKGGALRRGADVSRQRPRGLPGPRPAPFHEAREPSPYRGRWLGPDNTDEVVLNQMALAQEPDLKVGDRVALSVDGRPSSWRIAGFVEDIGSPAVAYVPYGAYARLTHTEGMTDTIRISLWNREKSAAMVKTREIEAAIGLSGASVISTVPVSLLRNAIAEHMAVLVGALLAMAILMAVVGTCGLMSTHEHEPHRADPGAGGHEGHRRNPGSGAPSRYLRRAHLCGFQPCLRLRSLCPPVRLSGETHREHGLSHPPAPGPCTSRLCGVDRPHHGRVDRGERLPGDKGEQTDNPRRPRILLALSA